MKISDNMQVVLHRCRRMNCIHEGQAFSIGVLNGDLGGREIAEATVEAMVAAKLLSISSTGTYILTSDGAEAVSTSVSRHKNQPQAKSWQSRRPPVNKLQ